MKTHTIRNKRKPDAIVTFTPPFFEKVLQAEPEAASLLLAWMNTQYKQLTGSGLKLDSEQHQCLLSKAGADEFGTWQSQFAALPAIQYKIMTFFEKGFLAQTSGLDVEDALVVANSFYRQLASSMAADLK